jgi:hypothetical protein
MPSAEAAVAAMPPPPAVTACGVTLFAAVISFEAMAPVTAAEVFHPKHRILLFV